MAVLSMLYNGIIAKRASKKKYGVSSCRMFTKDSAGIILADDDGVDDVQRSGDGGHYGDIIDWTSASVLLHLTVFPWLSGADLLSCIAPVCRRWQESVSKTAMDLHIDKPHLVSDVSSLARRCPQLTKLRIREVAGAAAAARSTSSKWWTSLSSFVQFSSLKELSLNLSGAYSSAMQTASTSSLKELRQLETLHIRGCDYTCTSVLLGSLCTLPKLRELRLTHSNAVYDVRALSGCKSLVSLDLSDTSFRSCQHLPYLPNLLHLRVDNGEKLESLSGLECATPNLLSLSASFQVYLRSIDSLTLLASLETLSLRHTAIESLAPISACTALQSLNVDGSPIADINALTSCTRLEVFMAHQTHITCLKALSKCKSLLSLAVSVTTATDISALSLCRNITSLSIVGTHINDADIEMLRDTAFPALQDARDNYTGSGTAFLTLTL